jgi:hypothetical protein
MKYYVPSEMINCQINAPGFLSSSLFVHFLLPTLVGTAHTKSPLRGLGVGANSPEECVKLLRIGIGQGKSTLRMGETTLCNEKVLESVQIFKIRNQVEISALWGPLGSKK